MKRSKKTLQKRSPGGSLPAVTAALAALGLIGSAHAAIEVAGTLYVDIDATQLGEGTLLDIPNKGTLGGSFQALGGDALAPVVSLANGTAGIQFNGSSYMQLADEALTVIAPPEGLVGLDATATIEVWAYNPTVDGEETMVSWGKRGGPDGTNLSFNYGFDGRWGAVGHWGNPDIGWDNAGGSPQLKQWHHLVYTYDGTTTRVYSDGKLANSEVVGAGAINTAPGTSINLATQLEGNGTTPTGGLRGSLSLARVRIHDGVLTPEQILSNYNQEKATFPNPPPVVAQPLASLPTHRYSFSESVAADANGLEFVDSIGGANGVVQGAGAKFSGTRLILPGGGSDTAAYGDLPNGLLSSLGAVNGGSGQVTVEGWVKIKAGRAWSRIFDFGSATTGEATGPGGAGNGADYLMYSAQEGDDTNAKRFELKNEDPGGGGTVGRDVGSFGTFGKDLHFAVTWKEDTGELIAYENGKEVSSFNSPTLISDINDVNVWLGRSNYFGDQNSQAEYDEVRIYNRVLSAGELLGNFQAGPDTLNNGEKAVAITSDPAATSAYESFDAEVSVGVSGSPPVSFQWLRNGAPVLDATNATYHFLAAAADNGASYSCIVSNFAQGAAHKLTSKAAALTVTPLEAASLVNRYSFNGSAGDTTATDSVSGADGNLNGGAAFTGDGKLQLDGVNGYVDLPNDLILALNDITIEAWVRDDGSRGWARIFDFGNSSGGENSPGSGTQYLFLSQPAGTGNLRGAYTLTGGGGGEQITEWLGKPLPTGSFKHVAFVSHAGAHTGRLFVDGVLVGSNPNVTLTPASLGSTLNNWLGRSQFSADPYFFGQFDEFRIWNGAMTPAAIAASIAAGPDAVMGGVSLGVAKSDTALLLTWPASATGYTVESSALLGAGADWQPVAGVPETTPAGFRLSLGLDAAAKYYRLRK